ncbi:hypothetical protein ACEPAF_2646 [Sanghuangporus sanghuang]
MTGFSALAVADDGEEGEVRWSGVSRILGPRWLQLPVLTVGLLGVQVLWSVEMSQASPYLIRLGLSKALTAIAFLAGPLSGLLVQPLIGVIADHSKSRFGRRRPYMLLASLICAGSMLLLGYTREFVSIFSSRGSSVNNALTILFAVFALYGLDFSVNAVQAVDRALIVDTIPASQQPDGNAWAARMLGLGSVLGFFIGNVDLTNVFSFLGDSELQVLSVIAAALLLSTQAWTASCVKEKVLVSSSKDKKGLRQEIREIWDNLLTLPRIIRQICIIQFLAWFAWFPVLFYTSVYVGDIYKKGLPEAASAAESALQEKHANIIGSRALFHHGLVALAANFFLPLFVKPEGDSRGSESATGKPSLLDRIKIVRLSELWAFSHLLFALCMWATFFVSTVSGASLLVTLVGFSWAITQWAPFSLLAEEILASSDEESFDDGEPISIRLSGTRIERASLEPISEEHEVVWVESDERQGLMEDAQHKPRRISVEEVRNGRSSLSESRTSSFDGIRADGADASTNLNPRAIGVLGNGLARQSHADLHADTPNGGTFYSEVEHGLVEASRKRPGGLQAKSGIIIGIHNLFIVIPQFISTAFTSLIFALFDPAKSVRPGHNPGLGIPAQGNETLSSSTDASDRVGGGGGVSDIVDSALIYARDASDEAASGGANSVAVVFRIGGIAATLAFVLSLRLARELKKRR